MPAMNEMAYTYLAYLGLTIGITVWVARTLRHNGLVFLAKSDEEAPLAEALSHLLIVGFYLVNFGVISFVMKAQERVNDVQTSIELLSTKVGAILVSLGMMHFLILAIFSGIKRGHDHSSIPTDQQLSTLAKLQLDNRNRLSLAEGKTSGPTP